ncbi:MAG: lysine transporter LysE [Clostridiales bacterium]|nr:lysine transporter LysE [Clostridiales bacterium]
MFSWIDFLTFTGTTSVTPGPNTILTFSTASRIGLKKTLPLCFGIFTGFFTIMLLSTVFCSILMKYLPMLHTPMVILGAVYLLYLAWHMYKSDTEITAKDEQGGFRKGLIMQFVNVKVYMNCILSLQGYILPVYEGQVLPLLGFLFLVPSISFLTLMLWGGCGSALSRFISRHRKAANTVFALALVYCAIKMFF